MRKLFLFFAIIVCLLPTVTLWSQDIKTIEFATNVVKTDKEKATIKIEATIPQGIKLFSTQKQTETDAYFTTIELDKSLDAYLAGTNFLREEGELKKEKNQESDDTLRYYTDKMIFSIDLEKIDGPITVKGKITWLAQQGEDFPSGEEEFIVVYDPAVNASVTEDTQSAEESTIPSGVLGLLGVGFLVGLAMVFTPCVFPLIPVTVSFFLKKSKNRAEGIRNALIYSLSIITIYTLPTLIIAKIFGDKTLYEISTSAGANLLFFAIFLLFAISFFGAFELTLPNKWANKTDERARKGGVMGIFFMALTLVIVSFSCTGPFVGSMLAQASSNGSGLGTVAGILGISAGLALPFSLFALFPSMLSSLPKSGGWLNTVKVVFGFIELALALKFLSNVDLQYHWGLLDREVFLAIWIVLAILMGMYLIGKLKFSHDTDLPYISVPRIFFAIATFSFAVYLIPGMWGAPLKFLSGILPPPATQDFDLDKLQYKLDNHTVSYSSANNNAQAPKKLVDKLHVPFGLTAYFDLEEGMAAAKALNKPVMLDFTGHSCMNCRKMENEVWSNPDVLKRIKENFVLISLYVDEKEPLEPKEIYKDKNGKTITTVGERNLDYQVSKFGLNAQPLYMFLDQNGHTLSDIKYGYNANVDKFIQHLDNMKKIFESK